MLCMPTHWDGSLVCSNENRASINVIPGPFFLITAKSQPLKCCDCWMCVAQKAEFGLTGQQR